MTKPGDRVKITTADEVLEGVLMPSPESDILVLKLDSGYNIGIAKGKITGTETITAAQKKKEAAAAAAKKDPAKPSISILHTGGTIASKVDYRTGAVYSSFTPEDISAMFPGLSTIANISSVFISNMWSDDLRFAHFKVIAEAVEKEVKKGADGVIIGMGTDNLAVASAAMAFIIEQTPIPIMFVGAQRSSDRPSSDAGTNLIAAASFIAKSDFAGVAICMHENISDNDMLILPATKTAKLHASRRDAFRPVNVTAIARVRATGEIVFLQKDYQKRNKSSFLAKPAMEEKVGLLKIHISMVPEQFSFFKGYKGLVIEGTGLGHTPGQVPNELAAINKGIYPAINEVVDSGCIVVMTSQTIYGRVQMHVYDKGQDLVHLGVIPGSDMLANTALVKLSWLLGNYPKEEVKKLITKNLRGELTARTEKETFLV